MRKLIINIILWIINTFFKEDVMVLKRNKSDPTISTRQIKDVLAVVGKVKIESYDGGIKVYYDGVQQEEIVSFILAADARDSMLPTITLEKRA